jgi:hypothetical protein
MGDHKHIVVIGGVVLLVVMVSVLRGGGGGVTVVQPTADPSGNALDIAQTDARASAFSALVQGVTGLEAVGVSAARDIHVAEIGGRTAVDLGRIQSQRDAAIATAQYDAEVKKAYYVSDAQITVGKANARAESNKSVFGVVGSVVSAVGHLFGF